MLGEWTTPAHAQDKPEITNGPLRQGDTLIVGKIKKGASGVEVQIKTDDNTEVVKSARVEVDSALGTFRIRLADPLRQGQKVQLRQAAEGGFSAWSDAIEVQPPPELESPVLTNTPLEDGDDILKGKMAKGFTRIEVQVAGTTVAPADVKFKEAKGSFRIQLPNPLQKDQQVQLRQVRDHNVSDWSAPVTVVEAECAHDCRDDLETSFHVGTVMDTFAGSEVQTFVNPGTSAGIQWRGVAGVDIAYRLWGDRDKVSRFKDSQLWIYGESIYGARSTQIDCTKNPNFVNCQNVPTPPTSGQEFFFILRNATTLEGFAGMQWEFWTLQPNSKKASANLYINAQAGFLAVAHAPGDVVDIHHVGLGGIVTNGRFQDSYFELGFGRTDLFGPKSKDRWKVDGHLTFPVSQGINFYIQLLVDADLGKGSDSVQTYFGFDLNLRNIRGWFKKNNSKE